MTKQKKITKKEKGIAIAIAIITLAASQLTLASQKSLPFSTPASHIIVAEEIIPPNGGKH